MNTFSWKAVFIDTAMILALGAIAGALLYAGWRDEEEVTTEAPSVVEARENVRALEMQDARDAQQ